MKNASSAEERQDIENRYDQKKEYEEERYANFKADPYYVGETDSKIENLRNLYKN